MSIRQGETTLSRIRAPLFADFNADGFLDVAYSIFIPSIIYLKFGYGNGSFSSPLMLYNASGQLGIENAASGDFDKDGNLDIVFTEWEAEKIFVVLLREDQTVKSVNMISDGNGSKLAEIHLSDLDNDANLDIVVTRYDTHHIGIYFGDGTGNFSNSTALYTGRNSYPRTFIITDLNGDHFQDIAVSNSEDNSIGIFLGYGNRSFARLNTYFIGGGYRSEMLTAADINEDGILHIIFTTYSLNLVGVLFGYQNGSFGGRTMSVLSSRLAYAWVVTGDFNHDGHVDVAVGQANPFAVSVLMNDGNGIFELLQVFVADRLRGSVVYLAATDLDNDGDTDLITADSISGSIYTLMNNCQCCAISV